MRVCRLKRVCLGRQGRNPRRPDRRQTAVGIGLRKKARVQESLAVTGKAVSTNSRLKRDRDERGCAAKVPGQQVPCVGASMSNDHV